MGILALLNDAGKENTGRWTKVNTTVQSFYNKWKSNLQKCVEITELLAGNDKF